MTTFLLAALGGVLIVVFRVRRARRRTRMLIDSPLAGFDTGVRSPYRVPRGVRFHKGL